ncbi:MAG: helix-turn-helix domain-containing protein [Oscillospiraceae bacterium]|jgi:transcriptional regulator with XRE-family HTH domain
MHQHIRDLREDKDLNQKQMAEILNIAQTTYSDYELGKINIPIEVLKKMSIYFNTSIDYLLDVTDVKKPYPRKQK